MKIQIPFAVAAQKVFWSPLPTTEERADRRDRVMKVFREFAEELKKHGVERVEMTYSETQMKIYYQFFPVINGKLRTLGDAMRELGLEAEG